MLYREALFEMLAKTEVWDALVEMGEEWLKEDMTVYDKQVARNIKQKVARAKMARNISLDMLELQEARDFDAEECIIARED